MKKTELIIPFTEKIAEAVGLSRETKGRKYFRCLRMAAYFPPEDAEVYAEKLCRTLLEKHEESLLYSEKGLWRIVCDLPEAEEIYDSLMSSWEKDAPDVYVAISRNGEDHVTVFGYEDDMEMIVNVKGRTVRTGTNEQER